MNRRYWMLGLSVGLILGGLSCELGSQPQRPGQTQPPSDAPAKDKSGAMAAGDSSLTRPLTVLLALLLFPDGRAIFDDARLRPFAFDSTSLRLLEAPAAKHVLEWAPPAGTAAVPGPPSLRRPPGSVGEHYLAVTFNGQASVMRLGLDLGWPGEGGGDVADRWHNGGVILRAPYYGPETRYLLVRQQDDVVQVLASTGVGP